VLRSGVVGLAAIGNPESTAGIAQDLALLTHPDEEAAEAAVLWAVLGERAVSTGKLDHRTASSLAGKTWETRLAKARKPGHNGPTGWAVSTVLDAWWCVRAALDNPGARTVLDQAVRLAAGAGGDTDTVSATTGALAGALCGLQSVPPGRRHCFMGAVLINPE